MGDRLEWVVEKDKSVFVLLTVGQASNAFALSGMAQVLEEEEEEEGIEVPFSAPALWGDFSCLDLNTCLLGIYDSTGVQA